MKIRFISFALLACIAIGLSSCHSSESAISYKEASHYFVRNDVTDYSPRLIQSYEEFERYFGMAATMGTDGLPTAIDFKKQNVIAIIESQTNVDTDIKISSIKKQDGKIAVRYKVVKTGDPRSYSTVPCLLLRIDKKYGGNAEFIKE